MTSHLPCEAVSFWVSWVRPSLCLPIAPCPASCLSPQTLYQQSVLNWKFLRDTVLKCLFCPPCLAHSKDSVVGDFMNIYHFPLIKKITLLSTNWVYHDLLILKDNTPLISLSNNWKCKHLRSQCKQLSEGRTFEVLVWLSVAPCEPFWVLQVGEPSPGGGGCDSTRGHRMSITILNFFYFFRLQMLLPTTLDTWLFISDLSLCVEGMDLPSPTLMAASLLPCVF